MVYIDTLVLRKGESGFSQLDPAIVAHRIELAEKTSGGLTIPPPCPDVIGVIDPADAEWLRRRLTPLPLNCYQVPIHLEHPLGNGVSKTYIACSARNLGMHSSPQKSLESCSDALIAG